MKRTYAIIYWKDATLHGNEQMSQDEWTFKTGLIAGAACGWIVTEDREHIALAMDSFYECGSTEINDFRCVSSYPKRAIVRIVRKTVTML